MIAAVLAKNFLFMIAASLRSKWINQLNRTHCVRCASASFLSSYSLSANLKGAVGHYQNPKAAAHPNSDRQQSPTQMCWQQITNNSSQSLRTTRLAALELSVNQWSRHLGGATRILLD
jgi:hypothetical protein